jgi:hypothetical protein
MSSTNPRKSRKTLPAKTESQSSEQTAAEIAELLKYATGQLPTLSICLGQSVLLLPNPVQSNSGTQETEARFRYGLLVTVILTLNMCALLKTLTIISNNSRLTSPEVVSQLKEIDANAAFVEGILEVF